ncbi:MAG: DNA translocase FtsK 4TM domain-containing protein [Pelagibacteraceae bacterium]|nr:DNA translocase FtsK 4TM domain-containing protein [Pelagibacteraceae bacterium]
MKLNSDTYNIVLDFFKRRFFELFGLILVGFFFLFIYSLINYSPEDTTLIYRSNSLETENILKAYSGIVADFFLQCFGLVSFLLAVSIFSWGVNLIINKNILNIISKIFYIILYINFGCLFIYITNNNSFWLVDNGNSGLIGEQSFNFINKFLPVIENNFFKSALLFLTLSFFVLGSGINLKKICINIFYFLKGFLKKNNNKEILNNDSRAEIPNTNDSSTPIKQQSFSFKNFNDNKRDVYKLPLINLLEKKQSQISKNIMSKDINPDFMEKILLDFGIKGKITKINNGPVVSLYEFEPAPGIKVSKIMNLSDDIARNTSSVSTRVSIMPGKNTIGIEIPNSKRDSVILSEIISSNNFNKKEIKLPIALGKSISGNPIVVDLASMPHLLVAGTTGSGKSVCINGIIVSLLYKHSPDNCKFILIDPKMLELSSYEGIPHLLTPVITEAKKATMALGWIVQEMENRYKLMTSEGVRNIDGYNQKHKLKMPYIVVVVDEMSDLMLVSGKEIESYVQKLSAMARAAGIHIIMATQRPSVDVITGTIKANFPTRISFQVSSKIDSKTILGEQGAEQLLGKGDMLFMSSANKIFRIHGPYVSESEVEKISSFLRSQGSPDYVEEIITKHSDIEDSLSRKDQDQLYETALEIVKTEKKASTSFLQRKLQIGYNRAARIIEQMEDNGVVSKANHVGKREVL